MSTTEPTRRRSRRGTLLWIIAFFCVLAAASYQRRTGPSYPLGGSLELPDGSQVQYELIRTQNSDRDAVVTFPASPAISQASLHYRRHGIREEFTVLPMEHSGSDWTAALPKQPAAGKLDYFLVATVAGSERRAPADPGEFVVIRFKNPVPAFVLVPHILMMFISMLVGLRCGLAAIFEPGRGRSMTWVTLFCLSVGGLFLGPVVQ